MQNLPLIDMQHKNNTGKNEAGSGVSIFPFTSHHTYTSAQ
jgi:hypothetical protein